MPEPVHEPGESSHDPVDAFAAVPVADVNPPRRVMLPAVLFVLTCLSTFFCGAFGFVTIGDASLKMLWEHANWGNGLLYMAAIMGVLLTHEMGHFLTSEHYGIPASWPYFLPMPLSPIGTMGAVIAMHGSRADRKQLFDIGLAGPLAGLVVCVPVLCLGIYVAEPGDSFWHQPLLTELMTPLIRPDLHPQGMLPNPLLMAGWAGLLVTGLNMMPISQLDGGHVLYALFTRRAYLLAYAFLFVAIAGIVAQNWLHWVVMSALVVLLGVEHPPTRNDSVPLGPGRIVLGLVSLSIPVLCFSPRLFNLR